MPGERGGFVQDREAIDIEFSSSASSFAANTAVALTDAGGSARATWVTSDSSTACVDSLCSATHFARNDKVL